MLCIECGGDMTPQKGVLCPSGTEPVCAPCWECPDCGDMVHVHGYDEFDTWLNSYLNDDYTDPVENKLIQAQA